MAVSLGCRWSWCTWQCHKRWVSQLEMAGGPSKYWFVDTAEIVSLVDIAALNMEDIVNYNITKFGQHDNITNMVHITLAC